ncbi:E3 ubiquitin-protein ligase RNF4 isoform X1 [Takifugu rubripes]|uniref:E3 ubiquitin-protein ligase RNF4-like isoform X1 n=1 Tax=Takifugu rubripes TaxID=31033 RepID=UPI00114587AE|nr:E3 ubiquitin-protein ligase RNF4-like isoform X1 [Takifugu rubripes]XP_029688046.1 E3 ubiquitin-protein ligase RNF4 isoform X1 [Takifugu rubripes]
MSNIAQRKRRTTGSPLVARSSTKTSRRVSARRAANDTSMSNGNIDSAAEPIDVADSVEEVVDLTCEGSECAVVDLTSNDSVLLLDEGPQRSTVTTAESYVVSSDEDDNAAPVLKTSVVSLHDNSVFRPTPGTISCPVCLDSYCEPVSERCPDVFAHVSHLQEAIDPPPVPPTLHLTSSHCDVCPAVFFLTIYNLTVLNDCQLMHIIDYSSYSLFFVFSNCVNKF